MVEKQTMGERLARVEANVESVQAQLLKIEATLIRIEASVDARLEKQDNRAWEMWAKIAALSGSVSLLTSVFTFILTRLL